METDDPRILIVLAQQGIRNLLGTWAEMSLHELKMCTWIMQLGSSRLEHSHGLGFDVMALHASAFRYARSPRSIIPKAIVIAPPSHTSYQALETRRYVGTTMEFTLVDMHIELLLTNATRPYPVTQYIWEMNSARPRSGL